jgi:hypothetical protein
MGEAQQLAQLRELSPAAEIWTDAGRPMVFLPSVSFKARGVRVVRDLLLMPWQGDSGYPSRLYLSERVETSEERNWNGSSSIQGRTWQAVSWDGVSTSLTWFEMVGAHLRAFQ